MDFEPLENVLIKAEKGAKMPRPARYIGCNKTSFVFEPLTVNFKQFKGGSKLLYLTKKEVKELVIKLN